MGLSDYGRCNKYDCPYRTSYGYCKSTVCLMTNVDKIVYSSNYCDAITVPNHVTIIKLNTPSWR